MMAERFNPALFAQQQQALLEGGLEEPGAVTFRYGTEISSWFSGPKEKLQLEWAPGQKKHGCSVFYNWNVVLWATLVQKLDKLLQKSASTNWCRR